MASLSESTTRIRRWRLRDSGQRLVSAGLLGTGSRLLGESQGASRKRCVDERTSRIAGKAPSQALFRHPKATVESSHGKDGVHGSSPSEGFAHCLLSWYFRCPCWRPEGLGVHQRPPWTSPWVEFVQQADRGLASSRSNRDGVVAGQPSRSASPTGTLLLRVRSARRSRTCLCSPRSSAESRRYR
jgi:hypothetical protein